MLIQMNLLNIFMKNDMKFYDFKINPSKIKIAFKNNFHILLGERNNGKKYMLEDMGFKVISYREYLKLKEKIKKR